MTMICSLFLLKYIKCSDLLCLDLLHQKYCTIINCGHQEISFTMCGEMVILSMT